VKGASEATRHGAEAVLVRSLTLRDDDVPHTGIVLYADDAPRIPAAALGIRSAERLSRALREDPDLRVRLELSARELAPATAENLWVEIPGREQPEEVVLLGCHLDGWDKGCAAHDDAAGCAQVVEALRLLKGLDLPLRRTVRGVLFMDEEMGGNGGDAYAASSARAGERHRFAIESDRGGFVPLGFSVDADEAEITRLRERALPFLEPLGVRLLEPGGGGVDIGPLKAGGCLNLGLITDSQRYFDVQHSESDVPDAVHPRELQLGAIAMATLALVLAEGDFEEVHP
jgi:hypothetical protein